MRPIELKKRIKKTKQVTRKRFCRFCKEKENTLDYKDIKKLEKFITDRGKIVSRRSSGNCALHQRMVACAIKRARFVALLPYVKYDR